MIAEVFLPPLFTCISQAKWRSFKYDDQDFHTLGLSEKGVNIDVVIGKAHAEKTFKAWPEDWEKKVINTKDSKSEILLKRKYGGICLYDIDGGGLFLTAFATWRSVGARGRTSTATVFLSGRMSL